MLTLREIAHIRSDFPEKFGIPRQSGLVSELISTVVFEPEYRVLRRFAVLRCTLTCGSSGSSPKRSARTGSRPSGRPGLEEIPAWAFSRRVRRFVRIHWVLAA